MRKKILVAPLNWGLGHATRCIPIIKNLENFGFEPIIGSDGDALSILKKEFPSLKTIKLPCYNIRYPNKGSHFKFKLIKDSSKFLNTIKAEKKHLKSLVNNNEIDGLISDNRFGVFNNNIPSVYLTHQLNVLSGSTTALSTKLHQHILKNFNECWVPDVKNTPNFSGVLGHPKNYTVITKYIGPISRFQQLNLTEKYDLMILLSGPEPQRTILESKLLSELKHYKGKVLFVKGTVELQQKIIVKNNLTIYNYMTSLELEKAINESQVILSRSGYTTIMDLAKLEKKAFFIPTPGQYEQKYLAKKLKKDGIAPYSLQDDFSLNKLNEVKNYKGFSQIKHITNYENLFSLFKCK